MYQIIFLVSRLFRLVFLLVVNIEQTLLLSLNIDLKKCECFVVVFFFLIDPVLQGIRFGGQTVTHRLFYNLVVFFLTY